MEVVGKVGISLTELKSLILISVIVIELNYRLGVSTVILSVIEKNSFQLNWLLIYIVDKLDKPRILLNYEIKVILD